MCITCKDDDIKVGDYVHRRAIQDGVRVGGKEIHTVTYLSNVSAVVEIVSATGTFLTEELLTYPAFVERYEKCK